MDEITGVPAWGRLTWPRETERLTLRPAPTHGGHGYATEAARELLSIAFEGLGMRREALHVAEGLHRDGECYDGLSYALLADEWRER